MNAIEKLVRSLTFVVLASVGILGCDRLLPDPPQGPAPFDAVRQFSGFWIMDGISIYHTDEGDTELPGSEELFDIGLDINSQADVYSSFSRVEYSSDPSEIGEIELYYDVNTSPSIDISCCDLPQDVAPPTEESLFSWDSNAVIYGWNPAAEW